MHLQNNCSGVADEVYDEISNEYNILRDLRLHRIWSNLVEHTMNIIIVLLTIYQARKVNHIGIVELRT